MAYNIEYSFKVTSINDAINSIRRMFESDNMILCMNTDIQPDGGDAIDIASSAAFKAYKRSTPENNICSVAFYQKDNSIYAYVTITYDIHNTVTKGLELIRLNVRPC